MLVMKSSSSTLDVSSRKFFSARSLPSSKRSVGLLPVFALTCGAVVILNYCMFATSTVRSSTLLLMEEPQRHSIMARELAQQRPNHPHATNNNDAKLDYLVENKSGGGDNERSTSNTIDTNNDLRKQLLHRNQDATWFNSPVRFIFFVGLEGTQRHFYLLIAF